MTTTTTATVGLEVQHVFDAAHRLPNLPGKCQSLHGHTWRVTVDVTGPVTADGIVVDMGVVKAALADVVDVDLDHGTMLGAADPLVDVLRAAGTKVFVFDPATGAAWPTVEAVAEWIGVRLGRNLGAYGVSVSRVRVAETDRNAAVWTP